MGYTAVSVDDKGSSLLWLSLGFFMHSKNLRYLLSKIKFQAFRKIVGLCASRNEEIVLKKRNRH
jgi:hypothetical protein